MSNKNRSKLVNISLSKLVPAHRQVGGLYVGIVVEDRDENERERYKVFIPGLYDQEHITANLSDSCFTTGSLATDIQTGLFSVRQALRAQKQAFKQLRKQGVLSIDTSLLPWATVAVPGSTRGGAVLKYQKEDTVWISFENGNIQKPVIQGSYFSEKYLGKTKAEIAAPGADVEGSPAVVSSGTTATNFSDISKNPDKTGVYECIQKTEQLLNIPENHLAAVAWKESNFDNNAKNPSSIEYSVSAFQVNIRAHPSFMYGGPIQTEGDLIKQQQTYTKTNLVEASSADWAQITGADPKCKELLEQAYVDAGGVVGQESEHVARDCAYASLFAGCFLKANYNAALKSGLTGDEAWRKAFERYNGSGPAAVAYSHSVQQNVVLEPWNGASGSVSSQAPADGASSPLQRSESVFSTLTGIGTAGGAAGAFEGLSNRREYHSKGPEISGHTSPEGHKILLYDGPKEDNPRDLRPGVGEEKIIVQTIFGHRMYFIDRPIEDRRVEIDTIGGHFIRMYDGDGSAGYIQISDPKGNHMTITSADDTLTIKTNKKIIVETEEYELKASQSATIESPHITLTSRDIKLGGPGASRSLSLQGTIDTAGDAEVSNLASNVKGI